MGRSRRRTFVIALGALLIAPFASAQKAQRLPRVGIIAPGSQVQHDEILEAFVQGMRDNGYVDGKDVTLDVRHFGTRDDELNRAIAALLALKPDVIVTVGSQVSWAAKKATSTIPVVMAVVTDPVGQGLVASLAKPGGNLTGNAILSEEVALKRLDLLHETLPKARTIGVLQNPSNPMNAILWPRLERAAIRLGVSLVRFDAIHPIDTVLNKVARQRPDALIIGQDNLFYLTGSKIAESMSRQRIPAIYGFRETVAEGGLMSYANSTKAMFRNAAKFVAQILKGARPSDLPIEQATTFELVINLKTAKALGIQIPQSLRVRADELIQ